MPVAQAFGRDTLDRSILPGCFRSSPFPLPNTRKFHPIGSLGGEKGWNGTGRMAQIRKRRGIFSVAGAALNFALFVPLLLFSLQQVLAHLRGDALGPLSFARGGPWREAGRARFFWLFLLPIIGSVIHRNISGRHRPFHPLISQDTGLRRLS